VKILLIDCGANFLDFALQCKKSGHEVKWFVAPDNNGKRIPVGDGLVEKVGEWQKWMRWSELTLTSDNTRYMTMLEPYRKLGYPIFGCNVAGSEMELNRTTGQKILKDAGVDIMPYKTFTSYDDAESFVKKTMKRYVSKPSGDANKALSYVSKSPADMIYMLRRWKKMGKLKQPFILQEFTPGIEMAVGGWFGKNGWSSAININFEHKKLMNGDLSVNTGEMGTVVSYVKKEKLANKVLFPASDYLMEIGYTGYIDVAVIIDENGTPWPLEYTSRPGWPHFQIISSLHEGDPVIWMRDLIDGYDSLEVKEGVSTGVVVTIPDFPFNRISREDLCGIPVYCDQENPNIHPAELMAGVAPNVVGNKVLDMPTWVSAGNYLLIATGVSATVSSSSKKAYEVIREIEIPNSPGYRTDIGNRLKHQIPTLQKLGYAKELTY